MQCIGPSFLHRSDVDITHAAYWEQVGRMRLKSAARMVVAHPGGTLNCKDHVVAMNIGKSIRGSIHRVREMRNRRQARLHWPAEEAGIAVILGHIAASLVGGRVSGTGAKNVAVVALEATITTVEGLSEKLAEEVHSVLLVLSTTLVTDRKRHRLTCLSQV